MSDGRKLWVEKPVGETENKKIQINCFGRLSIYQEGQEMGIVMNSGKAREFIAFLMTYQGAAVSKVTICEALWGNVDIHRSLDSLYKLVRKMPISFQLKSNRGMLQLKLDNVDSDLLQFEKLMGERDCIENLEQAVKLYRGSLYEEENYEWISEKDAFYDNLYVDTISYLKKHFQQQEESERAYYYESLLDRYA